MHEWVEEQDDVSLSKINKQKLTKKIKPRAPGGLGGAGRHRAVGVVGLEGSSVVGLGVEELEPHSRPGWGLAAGLGGHRLEPQGPQAWQG